MPEVGEKKEAMFKGRVNCARFKHGERVSLTLRFPVALLARLTKNSERRYRSRSSIIFDAVGRHLEAEGD